MKQITLKHILIVIIKFGDKTLPRSVICHKNCSFACQYHTDNLVWWPDLGIRLRSMVVVVGKLSAEGEFHLAEDL